MVGIIQILISHVTVKLTHRISSECAVEFSLNCEVIQRMIMFMGLWAQTGFTNGACGSF